MLMSFIAQKRQLIFAIGVWHHPPSYILNFNLQNSYPLNEIHM